MESSLKVQNEAFIQALTDIITSLPKSLEETEAIITEVKALESNLQQCADAFLMANAQSESNIVDFKELCFGSQDFIEVTAVYHGLR